MKDGIEVNPQPNVVLLAHDTADANFQANYIINDVTTSDNGAYTCTVTNPIGSDSQTINFIVHGELI